MATNKTMKRRKVWVTWQNTDGGGGGCGPNLYVDTEKTSGAVPFIEHRPGDVVLSREDVESLRGVAHASLGQDAKALVLALLRGG